MITKRTGFQGIQPDGPFRDVVYRSFKEVFALGIQHYWFRILPTGDEEEVDITHCLRMEWATLLPVMLYLGLISFRVSSVVNEAHIVQAQWDELSKAMEMKHSIRLEVTTIRTKGRPRTFYLCIGKPCYTNPNKQTKAFVSLPEASKRAALRQLKSTFHFAAQRILDHRNYLRLQQSATNENNNSMDVSDAIGPPNEQIEAEISNRFDNEIDFALSFAH